MNIKDPSVASTTLDNGLTVTTVAMPHLHTATCGIFVRAGARFERPENNGLSHFTEHMLFRGTERYPTSFAFDTAVARLGLGFEASTSLDYTLVETDLIPEQLAPAMTMLGELFTRPRLVDIELERERILEEINEDYDEQGVETNADDIARGLVFQGHPLGQRIIGPRRNVERFTVDDVRRHFQAFYGARNANLCVAGPVEHRAVVDHAVRALAAAPAGERAHAIPAPPPGSSPKLQYVPDPGSQTSLVVAFHAVPEIDPDHLALALLISLLSEGPSARLHHALSDQQGLAYSINAHILPVADAGMIQISGATSNAKTSELVRALLRLLDEIRHGEVDDDEIATAKLRTRYGFVHSLDDPSAMADWFGGAALYYPPPSLSERLAAVERVTVDDVVRIANMVLTPERMAIAAVGKPSRAQLGDLREIVSGWK